MNGDPRPDSPLVAEYMRQRLGGVRDMRADTTALKTAMVRTANALSALLAEARAMSQHARSSDGVSDARAGGA